MKARVFVTLKPSVFDPQGKTIADALHSLGYTGVADVRQGKYFELDLATTEAAQAKQIAAEVADKVLANPVIESYRVEVPMRACLRSRRADGYAIHERRGDRAGAADPDRPRRGQLLRAARSAQV